MLNQTNHKSQKKAGIFRGTPQGIAHTNSPERCPRNLRAGTRDFARVDLQLIVFLLFIDLGICSVMKFLAVHRSKDPFCMSNIVGIQSSKFPDLDVQIPAQPNHLGLRIGDVHLDTKIMFMGFRFRFQALQIGKLQMLTNYGHNQKQSIVL